MPSGPVTALRDVSICDVARRVRRHHRAVGLRQIDAAAPARVRRHAHRADRCSSKDATSSQLSESERSRIRLTRIGFVFQRFFLLPMLDAWENVELPQAEVGALLQPNVVRRTRELLEYVGLGDRAHHRPSQLSGGEMQRVAIARALANRPALLLADEPTGELDEDTGDQIANLFDRVHADGTAIVVVTHNADAGSPRKTTPDDEAGNGEWTP